jgi:hypothetical protein
MKNFASTKTQISHKYLNHGRDVPTQKCFKLELAPSIYKFFYNHRSYSTTSSSPISSVKFYEDAFSMRKLIIKDNKDKSGIYK